jgi:aspartyl aminopeptidase
MQKQKKLSCKFFLLTNAPSSLHSWLGLLLIFQLRKAKRKTQKATITHSIQIDAKKAKISNLSIHFDAKLKQTRSFNSLESKKKV